MLDRKDELARLVPHLVPQPDGGPLVERPVASTDGAGDHPLASLDEATDNGRWVVQRLVDAPTVRWRVVISGLAPLEVRVPRDMPDDARAIIATVVDAARHGLDTAPLALDVDVADGLIMQIAVVGDATDDTSGFAPLELPPLDGPMPVPEDAAVWNLDDGLAVHAGGTLLALEPVASYVWAANADGLSVAEIAAESDVDAVTVTGLLAGWRHLGDRRGVTHAPRVDRWNLGASYRLLGRTIRVAVPSAEVLEWIAELLEPVADTDDVDGSVVVARERGGWRVEGRWVPTDHQVAALLRDAALRAAAALDDQASFEGSALAGAHGAVVVLGSPAVRRDVLIAWQRIGGRVLADGVVRLDELGTSAEPAHIGLVHRSSYQWIDGEPAPAGRPGAPIVAPAGELVARWTAPQTASATAPLPIRMLVLAGEPASDLVAAARHDALREVLAARIEPSSPIGRAAATALVHLVRDVPVARGPLEAPSVIAGALRDHVLKP